MSSTSPASSLRPENDRAIYKTFYKKGHQMIEMHFTHNGSFDDAVSAVKNWCYKRHLKHIHTVPFLTSLEDSTYNNNGELEEIDIS